MKNVWILLLGLLAAAPLMAQDEEMADDAAAEEAAPADEGVLADDVTAGDEGSVEEEAVEEIVEEEAPVEEAAEEAPAEEAVEETEVAEEGEAPDLKLYVGLDGVNNTVSISGDSAGTGGADLDSKMYKLRIGTRLFEAVGTELQVGFDNSDTKGGELETESFYGLFIVPTATLFETVELAFPVGFASTKIKGLESVAKSTDGAAYGVDLQLPMRLFGDSFPDIRLSTGYMVYMHREEVRVYGANFGLRYDFGIAGMDFGNPFAGAGGWFSGVGDWFGGLDLWPFGDDEEEAAEGEEAAE